MTSKTSLGLFSVFSTPRAAAKCIIMLILLFFIIVLKFLFRILPFVNLQDKVTIKWIEISLNKIKDLNFNLL